MSDHRRLILEDPSDAERLLLQSARLDVPSESGRQRTVAALGIGGTLLGASSAGAAGSAGAGAGIAISKWVVVGMLAGGLTLGSIQQAKFRRDPIGVHPTPLNVSQRVSVPDDSQRVAATSQLTAISVAGDAVPVEGASPAHVVAVIPSSSTRAVQVGSSSAPKVLRVPVQSPLATEAAALDRARELLAEGDPSNAIRRLDAYAAEFPFPILAPEASVLRVEALQALGRAKEAQRLGENLLQKDPSSAHAQKLRSLLSQSAEPRSKF